MLSAGKGPSLAALFPLTGNAELNIEPLFLSRCIFGERRLAGTGSSSADHQRQLPGGSIFPAASGGYLAI